MVYNFAENKFYGEVALEKKAKEEHCVFISHKKEDEKAAIEIGKFLLEQVGVNIYLDIKDCILQEAVSNGNDKKIVDSIKFGLSVSTHILCLISDKTRLSWWVPYEIGIADVSQKNIASLKLASVDDIPSFLKIHETIFNVEDLLQYASKIKPFSNFYGAFYYSKFRESVNNSKITQYVDC